MKCQSEREIIVQKKETKQGQIDFIIKQKYIRMCDLIAKNLL